MRGVARLRGETLRSKVEGKPPPVVNSSSGQLEFLVSASIAIPTSAVVFSSPATVAGVVALYYTFTGTVLSELLIVGSLAKTTLAKVGVRPTTSRPESVAMPSLFRLPHPPRFSKFVFHLHFLSGLNIGQHKAACGNLPLGNITTHFLPKI